ncbi:MAG: hypothetical protein ABFS42_07115 [Candidatus Krumholzibacteriota bacterium]
MKIIKGILVFFTLILFSSTTMAAVIIVDKGGSGDALTIQGGLDLAGSGDTVTVNAGTYVENITMVGGVVLISSSGPGSTIINGNGDMCISADLCGPGNRISGFTLTNGGGYIGGGVRVYDHTEIEIDNNIFLNNHTSYEGAGVSVQMYSTADIHDNDFIGNISYKSSAITVIEYAQATITNNFFNNNTSTNYAGVIGVNRSSVVVEWNRIVENRSGSYAGNIDLFVATCELRHNTFLRNLAPYGASCIRDGGSSQLIAEYNLFAHNSGGAPAVRAVDCQIFSFNIFWDNGIDYIGPCDPIGTADNAHVNSMVCQPTGDDCAVSQFSPCLTGPGGLIGFNPAAGCTDNVVSVETESWGSLKALFR